MTPEILLVFAVLAATIVLFVSDRLPLDLVAMLALLTLLLTGTLTVGEALAGFADPIILTIAGLFVVGAGLFQTGTADILSQQVSRIAGTNETRLIIAIMLIVALLSAFLSSTGTVAVFLPVVVSLARRAGLSPARLLMPLAYASLLGGMLTLIGTPPNIVVSNQLQSVGLEPFAFFAFTPIGLIMLLLGVGYMLFVGRRLLGDRNGNPAAAPRTPREQVDLVALYGLPNRLFRLRVPPTSPLVGRTLAQADLRARFQVNVLAVDPPNGPPPNEQAEPIGPTTLITPAARLLLKGARPQVERLVQELGLELVPAAQVADDLNSRGQAVVEVVLTPRSRLIGSTLRSSRFRDTYHVTVLAVQRQGAPLDLPTSQVELRFGDTLLVRAGAAQLPALQAERDDFVVVGQPPLDAEERYDRRRAPLALGLMLAMLLLITFEWLPTVTAVLLAALAMVLSGCVKPQEAYRSMNWPSLVLIAAMLPMATALEKTGGMSLIAGGLTATLGGYGAPALIAGLFVLTSLFSQFISNTATTVLMAPIALQAAQSLDVSPYPLLMAVAIAASTAFATPIASPVNTLVLGPSGYRFSDFVKVGVPLQVLLMLAALLVLPLLFPL